MAGIRTFTKNGKAVNATPRPGIATSPLGTFDPNTGTVWQHPRIKADPLSGNKVTVTNAKASLDKNRNSMTGSIGMGGAGQRGRNRDVGSSKAKGEA